MIKNLTI